MKILSFSPGFPKLQLFRVGSLFDSKVPLFTLDDLIFLLLLKPKESCASLIGKIIFFPPPPLLFNIVVLWIG